MVSMFIRGLNWCRRFRHRKGYGVHSPSDFYLITFVIYERAAYYDYEILHRLRSEIKSRLCYREKVERLLFRLANYLQPEAMLEMGTGSGLESCYLVCGKRTCLTTFDDTVNSETASLLKKFSSIGYRGGGMSALSCWIEENKDRLPSLIHVAHTPHYEECVEAILPYVTSRTCLVVGRPYATSQKQRWWKRLISDQRIGVTFDLYDVGIVFFDKKRIKEHRIVNFL